MASSNLVGGFALAADEKTIFAESSGISDPDGEDHAEARSSAEEETLDDVVDEEVDEVAAEVGQSEGYYSWPSDTDRFDALASTMVEVPFPASDARASTSGEAPLAASGIVNTRQSLSINPDLRGRSQTAQHCTSTFRILCSRMRSIHQAVFKKESTTVSDETFWVKLFASPLDVSWRAANHERLRQRLDWVLGFIRKGTLSTKAQTAKDILQEPDLCPEWVKTFLAVNGALSQVEEMIQSHGRHSVTHEFCNTYSSLVAQLWEEAMSPTSFRKKFGTLRILESLRQRSLHVKKDCPSYLDRPPSNWTQEEDAILCDHIETKDSWDDVVQSSEESSGKDRPKKSPALRAKHHGWNMTKLRMRSMWLDIFIMRRSMSGPKLTKSVKIFEGDWILLKLQTIGPEDLDF
ncbi:hypothetical protein F4824DRAFT_498425 [Ustulina deusta]|nr:hypothetical protein F4824DRAFT_498425 [Ustulina deusta]